MTEIRFKFRYLIWLSTILFYKNVYSYHVTCDFPVGSISGTVSGFVGKQEFDKFLKKMWQYRDINTTLQKLCCGIS